MTCSRPMVFVCLGVLLGLLVGCAPAEVVTTLPPSNSTTTPAATASAEAEDCADATRSYDPLPALPASDQISDPRIRAILDRGFLIVAVSGDTRLLGARNPLTGQLEGFDIDLARAVARALFGSPDRVQFRVITAADRVDVLERREVDVVARNMTMTCTRWKQVAFSAQYYTSGQKLLVHTDPGAPQPSQSLADMAGQRVCAPEATSSFERILIEAPDAIPVPVKSHTDCLVLFQLDKADAITGDDVVLAGLADQYPYAAVTSAPPVGQEPYGLAFNAEDKELVRYVNRVLADYEADPGPDGWQASYDRWFAPALGPGSPPSPRYGRP